MKVTIALCAMLSCSSAVIAQDQAAPFSRLEPETQLQDRTQRQPAAAAFSDEQLREPASNMATGVFAGRYIGDASKAPSRQWENVMFTQSLLTQGDPDPSKPGDSGAVLRYNKSLDLATLPAKNITALQRQPDQLIVYVESGEGRLDDGKQFWDLREGVAVLLPPGAIHRFTNIADKPLKMLVLTQIMDPSVKPRADILVRDTNLMAMSEENVHWSNMSKYVFLGQDGLFASDHVLLVYMGPMTMAGAHSHTPGQEEIWAKVSDGPTIMQVGNDIRRWTPNMAVLAPPNGRTVHAAINLSDSIQYWFYFGRLNPVAPSPDEVARRRKQSAHRAPPNPFITAALKRSTIAGKPLTELPAGAYRW